MEFDIIEQYFKPLSRITRPGDLDVELSASDLAIGDDGALITPPANAQLVVVTDTLVNGVHFSDNALAYDIGWKALAVNLSDLAAMGAKPAFYSLALTLPHVNQAWLSEFTRGLADCASPYGVALIGGDTTRGPLSITVTAQGWVEQGRALLRSGAKLNDDIYVSGMIGEAGLGLSLHLANQAPANETEQLALQRLHRPQARVELGCALVGLAHSAVDVSDGLLADLNHILHASKLGANLHNVQSTMSDAVKNWAQADVLKALQAGDDYELCFTTCKSQRNRIVELALQLNVPLHLIGETTASPGLVIDKMTTPTHLGYQHF